MNSSKDNLLTTNWCVCTLALFCCLLWGSAFPSIKVGYSLFHIPGTDTAAQILFAGCRFALAGILVIIFASIPKKKLIHPCKATFSMIIKLSLLQTVMQYCFFYIGLAHTSGVKGSIITASSTFFAILISSLIFKLESLQKKKLIGCFLGFLGVVIINLNGEQIGVDVNLLGDGFILISAIASAFSSVLIKQYSQKEDPVTLSGYQFLLGGAIMIIISYIAGGRLPHITVPALLLLLYMAFLSATAYTIWGILLKYNSVSRVTIFGFANPVFGVLLSTIILKEGSSFGIQGVLALILVCIGIFIVNYSANKKMCS